MYLDNAATSFPKPAPVLAAVTQYMSECGVAAGRGSSRKSAELDAQIAACRGRLARLLGAESPQEIAFTFNGTDSLNLAIHGCLQPGDHIVTTELEHNSVLRPLRDWEIRKEVQVTHVAPDADGRIDSDRIRDAIRPSTRLVAITHASNVTGVIQPIHEVGDMLAKYNQESSGTGHRELLYLVDAAQTAGHVPIDIRKSHIDLMCCSGHKGLLGPLGTGVFYVRRSISSQITPLRQGGTGSQSESLDQPLELPGKYESGNPNAVGIVGLGAAIEWLEKQDITQLQAHHQSLLKLLFAGLAANPRVRVVTPDPERIANAGVVSFVMEGLDSRVIASILDGQFGIEVRAGLHCAPLVHRQLRTADTGGTIRASVGPMTTEADIDALSTALLMISTAM